MISIKKIGLIICILTFATSSIFAQESSSDIAQESLSYDLQLDWENISQKFLSESSNDSAFDDSYIGLTFRNRNETIKTYLQLYPNRQVFDISTTTTRKGRTAKWEGIFNLGYDSDIKSENKVIGHVQISHGIGISLRLAKKDNALDTFRKGGNNLILETTEQEDSILDNNTPAQTVELSYSTGNFQFSIVVENNVQTASAFGGASYNFADFANTARSLQSANNQNVADYDTAVFFLQGYNAAAAAGSAAGNEASRDASSFLNWHQSFNRLDEFHRQDYSANRWQNIQNTATSDKVEFLGFLNQATEASTSLIDYANTSDTVERYYRLGDKNTFRNAHPDLGDSVFNGTFGTPSNSDRTFAANLAYTAASFVRQSRTIGFSGVLLDATGESLVTVTTDLYDEYGVTGITDATTFVDLVYRAIDTMEARIDIINNVDSEIARALYRTARNFEDYLSVYERITTDYFKQAYDNAKIAIEGHNDIRGYRDTRDTTSYNLAEYFSALTEDQVAATINDFTALYEAADNSADLNYASFLMAVSEYVALSAADSSAGYYDRVFEEAMANFNFHKNEADRASTDANNYYNIATGTGADETSTDIYMGYFNDASTGVNPATDSDLNALLNSISGYSQTASSDYATALIRYILFSNEASRDEMLSYYRSIFTNDDVNSGQSFSDASIDYFENILNQVKREQEILARITSLVTDLESVKSDNKALKINWQNDNLEVGLLYVTGSQTDLNINNSTAMTGLGIQYQLGAFNIFLNSFNSAIKSQYKNSTDNIDLLLEQTKSNMDLGLDYNLNQQFGVSLALATGSVGRLEKFNTSTRFTKEGKNTHSTVELGLKAKFGSSTFLRLGYATTTETGKSSAGDSHITLDSKHSLSNGEKITTTQAKLQLQTRF